MILTPRLSPRKLVLALLGSGVLLSPQNTQAGKEPILSQIRVEQAPTLRMMRVPTPDSEVPAQQTYSTLISSEDSLQLIEVSGVPRTGTLDSEKSFRLTSAPFALRWAATFFPQAAVEASWLVLAVEKKEEVEGFEKPVIFKIYNCERKKGCWDIRNEDEDNNFTDEISPEAKETIRKQGGSNPIAEGKPDEGVAADYGKIIYQDYYRIKTALSVLVGGLPVRVMRLPSGELAIIPSGGEAAAAATPAASSDTASASDAKGKK